MENEIDDEMIDPNILTDEDIEELYREKRHEEWLYWYETKGRFGI